MHPPYTVKSRSFIRSWTGGTLGVLAASLAFGLTAPTPAVAQDDTAAKKPARETIMVTARKKEESIQDTPLTVTAIGGTELAKFDYSRFEDVVTRIPTLNVQIGGSGSSAQVSLRGVGSSNITAAFDSAVALNFDGVVVSSMRVLQSSFFDVAQIEVLKGPQSLYFGKSASAGVISIKSANPTEVFEVGGKASYEFEERGYTLEGYASGPITDELGFRIAARYNDTTRQYYNFAHDIDPNTEAKKGQENLLLRVTFQWDPGDNFSANLKLNYVGHRNDGSIQGAVMDCNDNGVADPITLFSGALNIPAGYDCDNNKAPGYRYIGAPNLITSAPEGGPNSPELRDGVPFGKSNIFYGRLRWDWDINDDITLTSVTGYLDQGAKDNDWYGYGGVCVTEADCTYLGTTVTFAPGANGTSFNVGGGLTNHVLEQFTQEVRLSTSYDAPVNFMLGVFVEDRHIEFNTFQYAVNFSILGYDPAKGDYSPDWYKRHLYDNRALSIFGQVTWDITDRLELAGGVRWTDERKRNNILVPYMHSTGEAIGFAGDGFDTGDIIFKDDNLSPEATLTYSVTDDVNVYVAYKTGFKSGGIDNSALPSANLLDIASMDPELRQAAVDSIVYDSETAKGGEAGIKGLFFDQALQLNFTAYYYVFKNLQVQNFDAVAIQFQTSNASELTNKGLELDFNWITPVDGLSIYGTLALTSTKYTAPFDPNPNNGVVENLQGRKAARAPSWAGNIAVEYLTPFGNGLELGFTGNMAFSSKYWTNEDSFTDTIQKAYVTFDLNVSLGSIDGGWKLAFIGRNLTDKRAISTSGPRPFLIGGTNPAAGVYGTGDDEVWNLSRGRQLFLEASFRY